MATKRPQFAKLTRPRLHKAVARERLFSLLDDARDHKPAISVVGPPGAGKTTLVASWLDTRNIKGIWYQADPGDADLATLFYYLGEAAKPYARKRHRSLPRLTPEYLPDVEAFARRFFRELFSRLPEGATLVLDNYQELPIEGSVHKLIADAITELPAQCSLVLISREDLPPVFARYAANGQLTSIGWPQLRLDAGETFAIASDRVEIDNESLQYLISSTGGWAAGLILALEEFEQAGSPLQPDDTTQESIFNYFATQILDRVPEEMRRFLTLTALLPRMSVPVCNALTDAADAAEKLEYLYRRHLFTDRRPGKTRTYSYHALFRTFLLKRAAGLFSAEELQSMRARCAQLLEDAGDSESAVSLYTEARRWDDVQRLIVQEAPTLLAQGRWQTFDSWIGSLPQSLRSESPWPVYWSGMSRFAMEPAAARAKLEQAYSMFEAENDRDGSLLAASAIVQCLFLEAAEFKALDKWLPILEHLLETTEAFPSQAAELQVWSGVLVAIIFGSPGHGLTNKCIDKIMGLMSEQIDPNLRMTAAAALILHCLYLGKFRLGRELEKLVQPILKEPELTPLNEAFWYCYLGYLSVADHTLEHGHVVFDRAEEIGEREGFHYVLTTAYSGRAVLSRVGSEVDRLMKLSEPNMETTRPYDVAHYLGNSLWRAADRGDWQSAVKLGEQTMMYLRNAGTMYQRLIWEVPYAWAWSELGNTDEARRHVAISDALLAETGATNYEALVTFVHANIARLDGDEDKYLDYLRKAFGGCARDFSQRGYAFWVPTAGAPRLCADALEHDIEPQFVRQFIEDYPLPPPADVPDVWPWPVRVYTLGRFEIECQNEPVTFAHKQPRKPLALLKILIALGEVNVPLQKLIDALWPDLEGDAAERALEVALGRLRKILAVPAAIQLKDRTLSLSRAHVWTDACALDAITEGISSGDENGTRTNHQAQRSFNLYKGDFLSADMDAAWAVSRRERLRGRFVQLVSDMASTYESAQDWENALRWYHKGLEVDDLAESFYQGVMRSDLALDKRAEGLSTFRRMRQVLSVTLGSAPSAASEALYRDLQSD
jgi:LuxR family transcriptional regulator, maltose regulon positive regulatory protein